VLKRRQAHGVGKMRSNDNVARLNAINYWSKESERGDTGKGGIGENVKAIGG